MSKQIVITGAFSNHNSLIYKGLCRWQIRALDNLDRYCEYIGSDLLVIDNSTPFNDIYNKIRKCEIYCPGTWAPATLCSVYGFLTALEYDEIIWIDLDLIPNKSKNIFEEMPKDFHIMHNMLCRKDESSFFHIKRKTEFLKLVMDLKEEELYNTNAGLVKMSSETRNKFELFCKEHGLDIRNDDHIKNLLIKYEKVYSKQRYEFICDECIYDAFSNITKIEIHQPIEVDLSYIIIKKNAKILEQKTDRFIHFPSEDKKYIPAFLNAQKEA